MNQYNQAAYRPAVRLGDKAVTASSQRLPIGSSYRTLRLTADADVYVDFGDSTVVAVVGQGLKLRGGAIETFMPGDNWTHFAYIAAADTSLNITFGEGE